MGLLAYGGSKAAAYGTSSVRPLLSEAPFWLLLLAAMAIPVGVAAWLSRHERRVPSAVGWVLSPVS